MSTWRESHILSHLREQVSDSPPPGVGRSSEGITDPLRHLIVHGLHLGHLQSGDRLPSIRSLSRSMGAGFQTVVRAYDVLASEGLVEKRDRSGMYVAFPASSQEELRSDTTQWLAEVFEQAYKQNLKIPHLARLMQQWTVTEQFRCACVESDEDHLTALCAEMRQHFGLESQPVHAEDLGRLLGGSEEPLPPEVRQADVLITTALHASSVRRVAERLGKPFVAVTVNPEAVAAAEQRLQNGGLTVVCVDPRFGERIREIGGGRYRARVRVVLADDREGIAGLPPSDPVLLTRAAQERLGKINRPLLTTVSPSFAGPGVRRLSEILIQLNLRAAG